MVGHVDDSGGVGSGLILRFPAVVVVPPVGDGAVEVAWVAFFAVGAEPCEAYAGAVFLFYGRGFPHHAVEAVDAAVYMAGMPGEVLVERELHEFAVEHERAFSDAVAETAYKGAEEALGSCLESFDIVVAGHYVYKIAVAVGHFDRHYSAAVVDCFELCAVFVCHTVEGDGFARRKFAERQALDLRRLSAAGQKSERCKR